MGVGDDGPVTINPWAGSGEPDARISTSVPTTHAADEPTGPSPRTVTMGVSLVATTLLLAAMIAFPAPYAIRGPGPTEDTLGSVDGTPLISIEGAPTYKSSGELLLTTVSIAGGPGHPATITQVVEGWLDPEVAVTPVETVFPRGTSAAQTSEMNHAQMVSSQENATVAALTELGYDIPAVLTIEGAETGSGADGVVRRGDVITSLNAQKVDSYQDFIDDIEAIKPGDTAELGVTRDGKTVALKIVTTKGPDGSTRLGVYINPEFDFPVDVKITIDDIGGPSAGTMFALGIIDRLTPEDEVAGQIIAGTGTMSVEGDVGEIGGIEQKMVGARDSGAKWFLAPAANCKNVVGNIPKGLRVVKVETLSQAYMAVTKIGAGQGSSLPSCVSS